VKPEPGSADALAVRAMDRVLTAEREAQERIAACERRCQQEIEQARERRQVLLARVEQRIVALHARAAQALLERSAAVLRRQHEAPPAQAPNPEVFAAALAQLAVQLLSGDP
jgi:vacuolar-type H+-ATPase subunit H